MALRRRTKRVRVVRPADLELLVQLEERVFDPPWSPAAVADEVRCPAGFQLLAFAPGGEAVGYAAFRATLDQGELLRLAVLPAHRRRGYGRELLGKGLARLAWEGVRRCFLEVREDNADALRLYRAAGFAIAGRRRRYYPDGVDAVLYARPLEAAIPAGADTLR